MQTGFTTRFPSEVFYSGDQQTLDDFCAANMHNQSFERLTICGNRNGYTITDFGVLKELASLKGLILTDRITSDQAAQICELTQLEELRIDDAGNLENLDYLAKLVNLHGLSITIPMERRDYHSIASIKPLSYLTKLEWLNLASIKIKDGGLDPLSQLSSLQEIAVTTEYRPELERLQQSNPKLKID